MLEIIRKQGVEQLGRFYSKYRGIVVDDDDPKNLNRLLVNVYNITYENVWAWPVGEHGGNGTGFKYLTPQKGDIVFVEFMGGDTSYPVWSYCGWAETQVPEELKDNDSMGFVTPQNTKVILDDLDHSLTIEIGPSDNRQLVKITEEGILITSPKDFQVEVLETASIDANQVKITGTGTNPKIILNNGSQGGLPISSEVTSRLNIIEQEINALKTLLPAAVTAASGAVMDSGAAAFGVLVSGWSTPLVPTTEQQISNDEITQ